MREVAATVRELLVAAQAEQKAKLDAGRVRVDTVFIMGYRVLLRTKEPEQLDAADIGTLRTHWDGPFTVIACPNPNAYTLALPCRMRCSPTVNVDRLKPFFERAEPTGRCPTWGRRVNTMWSCCSIAGRRAASHATWCDSGGMHCRTMSGCAWSSCRTARRSWRSMTPPPHAAAPLAGLPRTRTLLRPPE